MSTSKKRFMESPAGSTIDVIIESHAGQHILCPITRRADEFMAEHFPPMRNRSYAVVLRRDLEAIEAALLAANLRVVFTDL